MYQYTHQWFIGSEIKQSLLNHLGKDEQNIILEIGSYEGLSSCWFSDNLLSHPNSSLDCVDPFDESDPTTPLTNQTETIFNNNIKKSLHSDKCNIYKMYSNNFFLANNKKYNFIYIDGSHIPQDIKLDIENSWKILVPGGIMWMDDYLGADGISLKNCMDNTLQQYNGQFDIIHSGYQLAIRKRY